MRDHNNVKNEGKGNHTFYAPDLKVCLGYLVFGLSICLFVHMSVCNPIPLS